MYIIVPHFPVVNINNEQRIALIVIPSIKRTLYSLPVTLIIYYSDITTYVLFSNGDYSFAVLE